MLKLNAVMSLHGGNSNQVNPSVNWQRAGNKVSVNHLIKEVKNLIDIQENVGQPDKAKVIANHEMLSTIIQLIKPYNKQILDSIDTEADMEREIFEGCESEKSVSELIISINMWLKSHYNEAMSDGTVSYPVQIQILKTRTSQSDLNYQDKTFRLFPEIIYNFSHFGKFLIVQSIRLLVLLLLINFPILKLFSPGKQKMY